MPIPPARLEWAWVAALQFESDPEFEPEKASQVQYNVEPTSSISDLYSDDDGSLAATVRLAAAVGFVPLGDYDGPLPFTLNITVDGLFRWRPDELPPDEKLCRAWLDYNGHYLLWPYLRAYVAQVTGMSHLPPLTIYTMNVPKPPVMPDEAAESSGDDHAASDTSKVSGSSP